MLGEKHTNPFLKQYRVGGETDPPKTGTEFDALAKKYQEQGWDNLSEEEQLKYRSWYGHLVAPSGENQVDAVDIMQPAVIESTRLPYGSAMRDMVGNAITTGANEMNKATSYRLEALSAPFAALYSSMEESGKQVGNPYLGMVLGANPFALTYNTANTVMDEKDRHKILPKYDRQADDVQQSTLSSGIGVDRSQNPYLATGLDVVGGILEPSFGVGVAAKGPKIVNETFGAIARSPMNAILNPKNFKKNYSNEIGVNPTWNPYEVPNLRNLTTQSQPQPTSSINLTRSPSRVRAPREKIYKELVEDPNFEISKRGGSKEQPKSIKVKGKSGMIQAIRGNKKVPNEYYFSADMGHPLEAGKAFLRLNELFPPKPTIFEPNSFSLDSYPMMLNIGRRKGWSMKPEGTITINDNAVHNSILNSSDNILDAESLGTVFRNKDIAQKGLDDINALLKKNNLTERAKIIEKAGGFMIEVPNYRLTRSYQNGGTVNPFLKYLKK